MDSHDEYAALLDAFIDGELSGQDADAVRERLSVRPEDRDYVTDALAMRDWFPDAEETVVPERFAESVLAALPDRRRRASVWRNPWFRAALPVAACVAVLLLTQGVRKDSASNSDTGGAYASIMDGVPAGGWADEDASDDAFIMSAAPEAEAPSEEESRLYDADAGAPETYGESVSVPEAPSGEEADAGAAETFHESAAPIPAPSATGDGFARKASGSASSASTQASGDTQDPEAESVRDAAPVLLCVATADAAALMEPYASAATTERGTWYVLTESEFAELRERLTDEGCPTALERVAPDALPADAPSTTLPNAVYLLLQAP